MDNLTMHRVTNCVIEQYQLGTNENWVLNLTFQNNEGKNFSITVFSEAKLKLEKK